MDEMPNKLSQGEFEDKFRNKYQNAYSILGKYDGKNKEVSIRHNACGRTFLETPFRALHKVKEKLCTHCYPKRVNTTWSLERLRDYATNHSGTCLEMIYDPKKRYHDFYCKKHDHRFELKTEEISKGHWCDYCDGNEIYPNEPDWLAQQRGGRCYDTYDKNNNKKPLRWWCGNDEHAEFTARYDSVKSGKKWCPLCSPKRITQEKCRFYIQKLLGNEYSFVTTRKVLNGLELDGYNEQLKLAFEFQGSQHDKRNESWQSSAEFLEQRERDEQTRIRCEDKDIHLIEVNWFKVKGSDMDLIGFVRQQVESWFNKYGKMRRVTISNESDIDIVNDFYKNIKTNEYRLQFFKHLAEMKNGGCTGVFKTMKSDLTWKCHVMEHPSWPAPPFRVFDQAKWCFQCSYDEERLLEILQIIAENQGGKCTSLHWRGKNKLHSFTCEIGHTFTRTAAEVHRLEWCPDCAESPL